MRDTVAAQDVLADLGELTNDTYENIDDVVAYCRALRDGHTDEEARQIANGEEGSSSGSPVARCCAQVEQAEPLTEEQFDQIQRAIYDLQESHTEGPPEDAAEAGAQAASHRLKVLLAKAGADESMIPGDAEVALSIAEGEA